METMTMMHLSDGKGPKGPEDEMESEGAAKVARVAARTINENSGGS
jgi:hypothetical protein